MNVNRRTLARSTAWALPAVTVAAAAPAFATSRQSGTLNWTFTAAAMKLGTGFSLTCDSLELTFDNRASTLDLVPTSVVAEANVLGTWQSLEQPNSDAIKAGTTHTMSVDSSTYRGFDLRFKITFTDASGATVEVPTTGNLKTGSCNTRATFQHSSSS